MQHTQQLEDNPSYSREDRYLQVGWGQIRTHTLHTHIRTHAHTHICTHTYTHTFAHTHTRTHTHTHIRTHTHTHTHTNTHTNTHTGVAARQHHVVGGAGIVLFYTHSLTKHTHTPTAHIYTRAHSTIHTHT